MFSEIEQRLFRRERQALASLSHANIARLIDGGITDSGTAYLAMEYVDGVSIDRFCRERRLDVRARLQLLLAVCRAVQHAHSALVVHRDIKPSNILVGEDGAPKLLDFGIAKLLDRDEGDTRSGIAALTPEYAAPEQFNGGAITTATDVFALGILMHELLTGARPEQTPPTRPSALTMATKAEAGALPTDAATLRSLLRGDLDNIILKALEAEPARRYASAGALGDDLDRYLDGLPVTAHPPSGWYRGRKFVQRHRGGVAVTLVLVVALLASLTHALWQSRIARQQARRAETELAHAQAITHFMLGMFEGAAPSGPFVQAPSVADLLASGARSLHENPKLDADTRDVLLIKLASVQRRWAQLDAAATNTAQVISTRTGAGKAFDHITLQAVEQLMSARLQARQYDEVNRLYRHYAEAAKTTAPEMAAVLLAMSSNADGRQIRASALAKARSAAAQCAVECSASDQLRVQRNLADVLDDIDAESPGAAVDLHEAEAIFRRLLVIAPGIEGLAHPNVADDYFELSYVLRKLGRAEEAAEFSRIGIERIEAVYAAPHPRMIVHYLNAGRIAAALQQLPQAQVRLRQALQLHSTLLPADDRVLPAIVIELAQIEIALRSEPVSLPHLLALRKRMLANPRDSSQDPTKVADLIQRLTALAKERAPIPDKRTR